MFWHGIPNSFGSRKLSAAVSAAILLLCAAFSLLGGRGPAIAATPHQAAAPSCASTAAIPDPEPAGLVADCETLLNLKDELAGDVTLNWNRSLPISDWEGVTTENDRVTVLDLFNRGLTGVIPAGLGNLTNLKELNLAFNQLAGAIPAELGNLTDLTRLGLGSNRLTGSIPDELANLTNIEHISLFFNQLTGPVPAWLGNLTNLKGLDLFVNQLTGAIPVELGNLTNLDELSLGINSLSGPIPAELGRLAKLTHLNLVENQLTGQIPAELGNLTNLKRLYLGDNRLTGEIPTWLGNLTKLEALLLGGAQLTGHIPVELTTLTYLQQLYLNGNQLTGTIPAELSKLRNLQQLHLASNQLTGVIPVELEALAALTLLNLASNQLTGTIPDELGKLTNLQELLLSSNQLTGPIPAEFARLTDLRYLALNSNDLTGAIPVELGKMTNLATLILADNDLNGTIPAELDNLVPPAGNLHRVRIATGNPGLCGPIPPALHALSPAPPDVVNDLGSDTHPTGNLGSCPSTPPTTPELTARAAVGAVELSWEAVQNAVRYELQTWWDADTGWQQLGGENLTGTSYTHTTVTAGITYYYSIRAINAAGQTSDWLKPFPAAAPSAAGTPPSTPELTARAVVGAVELSWEAVQNAARYELFTWWDAETGWQPLGGNNLTGTSYTHTTVTAGITYYYSIRAINAAGQTSDWLKPFPAAAPSAAGTPPSTPELTARAAVGAVELSWEAVQDAVRYELQTWWDAETGWQPLGGENLTGTSYTHSTVTAGITYYYSIRAVNAAGQTSDWLQPYPAATVPDPSTDPNAAAERAPLVALYNAATGPNWLSDRPLGEWHGKPPALADAWPNCAIQLTA